MDFAYQSSEVQDLGSLHHYRTEIPNIMFHLNLDPWAFKAYCVIKMTAGDKGACFKSNVRMSNEVGCSIPTLIKIKAQLVEKGLIVITKRKHESGGNMPDLIQIVDIWPQNMEYMTELYPKNPNNDLMPWRKSTGSKRNLGGGINDVNGGSKPGLHKQEHKEQEKKQQQGAAAVSSKKMADEGQPRLAKVVPSPANSTVKISSREGAIIKSPLRQNAENPPTPVPGLSTSNLRHNTNYQNNYSFSLNLNKNLTNPDKIKLNNKVYMCLDNIDIPEGDKAEISSRYSEECVKNALEYVIVNQKSMKTTLVQFVKWACSKGLKVANKPIFEVSQQKTPTDPAPLHRSYWNQVLKKPLCSLWSTLDIRDSSGDYLEGTNTKMYYKDLSFLEQLSNYLRKKSLNMPEVFGLIKRCQGDLMLNT